MRALRGEARPSGDRAVEMGRLLSGPRAEPDSIPALWSPPAAVDTRSVREEGREPY